MKGARLRPAFLERLGHQEGTPARRSTRLGGRGLRIWPDMEIDPMHEVLEPTQDPAGSLATKATTC